MESFKVEISLKTSILELTNTMLDAQLFLQLQHISYREHSILKISHGESL